MGILLSRNLPFLCSVCVHLKVQICDMAQRGLDAPAMDPGCSPPCPHTLPVMLPEVHGGHRVHIYLNSKYFNRYLKAAWSGWGEFSVGVRGCEFCHNFSLPGWFSCEMLPYFSTWMRDHSLLGEIWVFLGGLLAESWAAGGSTQQRFLRSSPIFYP